MNPEIRAKWVAALRGETYLQGTGAMHYNGSFCCLGVLCDLHSTETGRLWNGSYYLGRSLHLPPAVVDWAGITPGTSDPMLGAYSASTRNDGTADSEALSFAALADLIEAHL